MLHFPTLLVFVAASLALLVSSVLGVTTAVSGADSQN